MDHAYKPVPRPTTGKFEPFNYQLDLSQLAGIIGPVTFKVSNKTTAIVVIKCDDIYSFTPIKRPSRDDKLQPELTQEEKKTAVELMEGYLNSGVTLTHVPNSLPQLKGAKVVLKNHQYYITLVGKSEVTIEQAFNLEYQLPYHPVLEINSFLEVPLLYTGDGISKDVGQMINSLLNYDIIALRRLSMYLSGYKTEIKLNKISRDGGSVDYSVSPYDTIVNHLLGFIAYIYPAALEKITNGYKVKNGPLLWTIRDAINDQLQLENNINTFKWGEFDDRILKEHQREIVEKMIENHNKGKRGNIIWAPTGSGKTLCVLRYILAIPMKKYCVYTLPASAIDSVKKEFDTHKIKYQIIDVNAKPLANTTKIILPNIINFIEHDQVKKVADQLREHSSNMLFIVDEFHKALATTQRTSTILEIVSLCSEFIAMSGTIIKDENHEQLIAWLCYITNFEVTLTNYWVAIGALISKKFSTGITVERQDIEAEIEDLEAYKAVVPVGVGGNARNINLPEALRLCYKSITKIIVQTAKQYIQVGEGLFIVAKDSTHQQELYNLLSPLGVGIHLITRQTPITLEYTDTSNIKIVITTPSHNAGYTLTKFRVMLQTVYFSNQATRDQLESRLNRIGQMSDTIRIITIHGGILTYINTRYEKVRSLASAMKGFADDIGVEYDELKNNL